MPTSSKASPKQHVLKWQELRYIIYRNVFPLTNGIILAVVVLLIVFGSIQAGIFLGAVSLLNIGLGLAQDIRAWVTLANLQLLTAPRVARIREDGTEESVLTEDIKKGDMIRLKVGDQIPCDSSVAEAKGLEISEGLITGESASITKADGDKVFAGSIVTSGLGKIRADADFQESRIARMTEGIKKYSKDVSPIQHSVDVVVTYSGYVLLAGIIFVVTRGFLVHEAAVRIVLDVGAISTMIVPTGLVFAVTLFFAYGAANLFRKNVLLQEVNATEKLGRIKNLCMDKTGTLTENGLMVETMHVPDGVTEDDAKALTSAYMQGAEDHSEIMRAVKEYIKAEYKGAFGSMLTFSSWRQYGGTSIQLDGRDMFVLSGSPDIFMPYLSDSRQAEWLQQIIDTHSREGKHVVCVVKGSGGAVPQSLSKGTLSVVAVFVFFNNLRVGIRETVDFFQNRGVSIRIISGDNSKTVSAVALLSGIRNPQLVITGKEMEGWSEDDYADKARNYALFARVLPEQKEKIIDAMKKDGFTAMVGDGANDALAIKKADLGIAMFDGAAATRQLASVVLTNNSFEALPGGVELADTVIKNMEIFSSMFLNQTVVAVFLFTTLSLFGREFVFTPLNATFINYFAIGIPGLLISYWTIRPNGITFPATSEPFLRRVLPFVIWSSALQCIGSLVVYALSPAYLKAAESDTLVVLAFIVFGMAFFACAPAVYQGSMARRQPWQIGAMLVFEVGLLWGAFQVPFVCSFFNLTSLSAAASSIPPVFAVIAAFSAAQLALGLFFAARRGSIK